MKIGDKVVCIADIAAKIKKYQVENPLFNPGYSSIPEIGKIYVIRDTYN